MRGGEHRQVTLDLAPDVAQGDAEHSLVTVERIHLYGPGAAAWGKAVLGDGGTIITQDFDRTWSCGCNRCQWTPTERCRSRPGSLVPI